MIRLRSLVLSVAALSCAASVSAMTVLALPIEDLAAQADAVVLGTVEATFAVERGGRVVTKTTIAVERWIGGDGPAQIEVLTAGGRFGERAVRVAGTESYVAGEEVLVFLDAIPDGYVSMGGAYTKFSVLTGPDGTVAIRDVDGLALAGADVEPDLSLGLEATTFSFDQLVDVVGAVRDEAR
ncbi:MAG: hypothetical protein H6698_04820 [Myxococcales bacterium]|nr:hypothetical protein [Myxococcales bacterium]MCB9533624.1 hypothetical protein [Myxococcales bacterium]